MCRFVVYQGHPVVIADLLYKPKHSLVEQSMHAEQSFQPFNADGFGIGFYTEGFEKPCVIKSVAPAWSNMGFKNLSARVQSHLIFSHVRAASPGLAIQDTNCHPFISGKFQFMHNGAIGNFKKIKRHIQDALSDEAWESIQGSTDSEHAFAVFIEHIGGSYANVDVGTMRDALVGTIRDIVDLDKEASVHTFNFAVSDGRSTVVSRFAANKKDSNTLYYSIGEQYLFDGTDGDMIPTHDGNPTDRGRGAAIVASEPITRYVDDWIEVPQNHTVSIDEFGTVRVETI